MMKLKNVSINFKQRVEIEQQQTPLKVDYLQENSYLSWFFIIICSL